VHICLLITSPSKVETSASSAKKTNGMYCALMLVFWHLKWFMNNFILTRFLGARFQWRIGSMRRAVQDKKKSLKSESFIFLLLSSPSGIMLSLSSKMLHHFYFRVLWYTRTVFTESREFLNNIWILWSFITSYRNLRELKIWYILRAADWPHIYRYRNCLSVDLRPLLYERIVHFNIINISIT
jgi:hypothetical protein